MFHGLEAAPRAATADDFGPEPLTGCRKSNPTACLPGRVASGRAPAGAFGPRLAWVQRGAVAGAMAPARMRKACTGARGSRFSVGQPVRQASSQHDVKRAAIQDVPEVPRCCPAPHRGSEGPVPCWIAADHCANNPFRLRLAGPGPTGRRTPAQPCFVMPQHLRTRPWNAASDPPFRCGRG